MEFEVPQAHTQFLSSLKLTELAPASAPKQQINIKLLNENARLPSKAHFLDAGFDISSAENKVVKASSHQVISTGVCFCTEFPKGIYCRIAPRSGLAVKKAINIGAGVVDSGYTGEVKVCVFNHSATEDFEIKIGDKIAQLIFTRYEDDIILQQAFLDHDQEAIGCAVGVTPDTTAVETKKRNENGFGSTDTPIVKN